MRYTPPSLACGLIFMASLCPAFGHQVMAQTAANDTIYNPTVLYTSMPRTYEIAGIEIVGAPNYDDENILNFAGIRVGDRMTLPGDEITNVVKRLMRQALFSQVQVELVKTAGDKAWIRFNLRTQPRISQVNYIGMKKSEREDLIKSLNLMKGNMITQNIVNRTEQIVKKYFGDKGFGKADVRVTLHEDLSAPNEMIVDIAVDKHDKVKVHKIYIEGNEVLSDRKIKNAIKKTNEKTDIWKIFSQKKFVESDYRDDLNRILEKYNEKGYRDAKIVADSVVAYDDKAVCLRTYARTGH